MQDDFRPVQATDAGATDPARPEPTQPTAAAPSPVTPSSPAPKRSGAKKWLLGGLVVLLLAGAGAFAYWQWQNAENASSEATFLRTALEAAQGQNKNDAAMTAPQERVITTMELAERYAEAYQGAGQEITFSTRVEKTDGDAALVYTKAELPNALPTYFVLKRVDDSIVAVDSFSPPMSEFQATILKGVYGIDAARLGITVEQQ